MTDKQDWEKEFDTHDDFAPCEVHSGCMQPIKSFIHQTLQQERQRWIAELEGKKKSIDDFTPYPPVGHLASDDLKIKASKSFGYDQGLQTAIKVINGEKE